MTKEQHKKLFLLITETVLLIMFIISYQFGYNVGYKKAQLDMNNNKILKSNKNYKE